MYAALAVFLGSCALVQGEQRTQSFDNDPGWEGILKRGVYHIHKKFGVDESVMWGEFFFVEALAKALAALA